MSAEVRNMWAAFKANPHRPAPGWLVPAVAYGHHLEPDLTTITPGLGEASAKRFVCVACGADAMDEWKAWAVTTRSGGAFEGPCPALERAS